MIELADPAFVLVEATTLVRQLTFAWWNLHNYAHFDAEKAILERWPKRLADYETKRERISIAIREAFGGNLPDLLAVCEITRDAAEDLAAHLSVEYKAVAVSAFSRRDDFQVAFIYKAGVGLTPELPLFPSESEDVPRGTRPMIPMHLTVAGHVIRFMACHWTGFAKLTSRNARRRLASLLRRNIYSFLHPEETVGETAHHVVILGDLNEEPTSDLFWESDLIGCRDRPSSRRRPHWRDDEVRRVRLYNLAWRFLGEQMPHGVTRPNSTSPAGTCYHKKRGWRTFDHVLVSGGLLGQRPPYIDEENTRIGSSAMMLGDHGLPSPFKSDGSRGVSDHLPIIGRLILPEDQT